jgi:hypothetical protein
MSNPTTPSAYRPHCWHLTGQAEMTADTIEQEEVCCRCGGKRVYQEARKDGKEGHGPHVPGADRRGMGVRDRRMLYPFAGVHPDQCPGPGAAALPLPPAAATV